MGIAPGARLTNAIFTDAIIAEANLFGVQGFTLDQLYSTASYQAKNLSGIVLAELDLSGGDFSQQNLAHSDFSTAVLNDANLSEGNLTEALFDGNIDGITAKLERANLSRANLTRAQFYGADLSHANFQRANLTGAVFAPDVAWSTTTPANLFATDFSGANLKNVRINANSFLFSVVNSETTYNQWTEFPDEFDPVASGLTFQVSPPGDFNANDGLDHTDITALSTRIRKGYLSDPGHWPDAMFDVNDDSTVSHEDLRTWVHELRQTWFGDANLDGEFNSGDLISVLAAGKYEATERDLGGFIINPASWAEGDWNADGESNSTDLTVALADGGYEQGSRPLAKSVPEPQRTAWLIAGLLACLLRRWKSWPLAAFLVIGCLLINSPTSHADIYRWDNGQAIPGTEGIEPGPGVQLDRRQLEYANLENHNLAEANFEQSDLTSAWLSVAILTNANFSDANLTGQPRRLYVNRRESNWSGGGACVLRPKSVDRAALFDGELSRSGFAGHFAGKHGLDGSRPQRSGND